MSRKSNFKRPINFQASLPHESPCRLAQHRMKCFMREPSSSGNISVHMMEKTHSSTTSRALKQVEMTTKIQHIMRKFDSDNQGIGSNWQNSELAETGFARSIMPSSHAHKNLWGRMMYETQRYCCASLRERSGLASSCIYRQALNYIRESKYAPFATGSYMTAPSHYREIDLYTPKKRIIIIMLI